MTAKRGEDDPSPPFFFALEQDYIWHAGWDQFLSFRHKEPGFMIGNTVIPVVKRFNEVKKFRLRGPGLNQVPPFISGVYRDCTSKASTVAWTSSKET